jgi:hypothetical protein
VTTRSAFDSRLRKYLTISSVVLCLNATIDARLSAQTPAAATALAHVTVIDGTGAAPQRDMTVVIRNGVIAALFRSGSDSIPAGATVLDLTGHYVIPGLIALTYTSPPTRADRIGATSKSGCFGTHCTAA